MSKHNRHHHDEQGAGSQATGTLTAPELDEAGAEDTNDQGASIQSALKSVREFAGNVQERAVATAKATDAAVKNNPYTALAIAAGVGAVIGMLLARRSRND